MEYKREEHRNGFDVITTVDDEGNYEIITKFKDGTTLRPVKAKLKEMGWSSVQEFLRERKGFVKVGENNVN
ncbi:MAG: hypothetical protein IKL46_04740 [Clostridia bacterium]|nr:hypothetical protein [Clostridia bacterium]